MKLSNYLFFTTHCEEALRFYAACGLGQIATLVRHGEGGMAVKVEAMRGKILHARFTGPGVNFFASDNDDAEPMRGSAMIIELSDRAQTERLVDALSKNGQVTTALGVQPWGDYYCKLTDAFGVQWMLNCTER